MTFHSIYDGSTPILSIPVELLRHIFALCAEEWEATIARDILHFSPSKFRSQPCFVLSAVNRKFRGLAMGIPELWNYISLNLSHSEFIKNRASEPGDLLPIQMINRLLKLSSSLPLRVRFSTPKGVCTDAEMYRYCITVMNILADHSHRWELLELYLLVHFPSIQHNQDFHDSSAKCNLEYDCALRRWTVGRFPRLTLFRVVGTTNKTLMSHITPQINIAANKLREVILEDCFSFPLPKLPWANVVRYRGPLYFQRDSDSVFHLARNLVECSLLLPPRGLRGVIGPKRFTNRTSGNPILMRSLEKLYIERGVFVNQFTAPTLREHIHMQPAE